MNSTIQIGDTETILIFISTGLSMTRERDSEQENFRMTAIFDERLLRLYNF